MALQKIIKLGQVLSKNQFSKTPLIAFVRNLNYGEVRQMQYDIRDRKSNIAVILSGCGALDGTEIFEAYCVAEALATRYLKVTYYAPETFAPIADYTTGTFPDYILDVRLRDVFKESARIARGDIKPLSELCAEDVGGVVIPGGFGVTNVLSNYNSENVEFDVIPDLSKHTGDFVLRRMPVAFIGVAGILAARLYPNVFMTLGKVGDRWPYSHIIEDAKLNGADLVEAGPEEFVIDNYYKVFTTPGFMYNYYSQIWNGIDNMMTSFIIAAQRSHNEPVDPLTLREDL